MLKSLKNVFILAIAIIALILAYRVLFVRTVYYEIGGIKIPSQYNALTGSVKPILNYHGKPITRTVKDRKIKDVGLTGEQATLAQFRWAIFEQWTSIHPEYKGWDNNPDIFKKANTAFKKEMEGGTFRLKVVK